MSPLRIIFKGMVWEMIPCKLKKHLSITNKYEIVYDIEKLYKFYIKLTDMN